MRICGLDIETTGLSHADDHVTELAWCIKEVGDPKPLSMQSHFILPPRELWNSADYIKPSIAQLTKIKMSHLMSGLPLAGALLTLAEDLHAFNVSTIVAFNGEAFDKPFLQAKVEQMPTADQLKVAWLLSDMQWIDPMVDCVFPEDCRSRNLMYVAAYYGFVSPFPHAALFDVMTMLKVLDNFDIPAVAARAKLPWVVVRADVSYDQRQLAKERRYSWETVGGKTYPKMWVKRVKECDLPAEIAAAPFKVIKIA